MFRHYLTLEIASSFDRACTALGLSGAAGQELTRCSRNMLHYLGRAIRATEDKERSKFLYVAITYLRDCRGILDGAKGAACPFDVDGRYQVLHGRLERLLLDAAESEGGQLRMLG